MNENWNTLRTSSFLALGHDLDLRAIDSNNIESQVITRCTNIVDATSDADDPVLERFTLFEVAEVGFEVSQVVCNIELVRIRIGAVGLLHTLDGTRAELEVLLIAHVSYVLQHEDVFPIVYLYDS